MMKVLLNILICLNLFIAFCLRNCYGDCEVYGLIMKKGESKTVPGKCNQIICTGNRYDEYEIKSCPEAYAPQECSFVPVDLTKLFPKCCPYWKCTEI